MIFRIGINVGDVMVEDDNLFGDGVNIAARLEGIAAAGGICISGSTFDQVKNKVSNSFEDMGPQEVKNIPEPVRAYAIGAIGEYSEIAGAGATVHGARKTALVRYAGIGLVLAGVVAGIGWYWQSARTTGADRAALSILVLPFTNGTGDPQQGYIADGLTASVTSDLSRIRDAFVVAAATAYAYKDKPVDLRQLGEALGVRFVLQGSVQRGGNTIRINAQLADTRTNAQLWTETFEGDQANLCALQDQVTARIGNSIGREMVVAAARESETRVSTPQATDLILRARAAGYKRQSLKNWEQIESWYRQALKLDPDNATAMAGLARSLAIPAFNFGRKLTPDVREKKFVEGRDYALKAKELAPRNPMVYNVLALYASTHDDYPGFQRASESWLSLDPKNPIAYNYVANSLLYRGKPKEAIALLDQATALSPKHPSLAATLIAISYVRAYFMQGDNDAVIDWARRTLDLNPRFIEAYVFLAMAYKLKGNDAKSGEAVAALRKANPKFKAGSMRKPTSTKPPIYKIYFEEKYLPAARKAGLTE